jgi:hypothetical protein
VALVYTRAGLQAQLDAISAAIEAQDFLVMWQRHADYALVWAGIGVTQANAPGYSVQVPRPDALRSQLKAVEEAIRSDGSNLYEVHSRWVP